MKIDLSMSPAGSPHRPSGRKLDATTSGLATLLDDFDEGFIVLGDDWRVLLVNRAADAQGVADREGWLGEVLWDVVPGLQGHSTEYLLRKAMTDRSPIELELQWPPKPGSDFKVRLFPISAGLGVSFRDVTAENAVRAREREQANKLELLLAATDLGITYVNLETDEVTLSPGAAEILGVAPLTKVHRKVLETDQSPELLAHWDAMLRAAIESGEVLEGGFSVKRRAQGDEAWAMVRTRAQYDADGRAIGLLGVLVDISQLKRHEARLRESEARFRAFADCAPTLLWVTQADGRIEFINNAGLAFTGLELDDFVGQPWTSAVFHPDDREHVARIHDGAWEEREPYDYVARIQSARGEWRWVHAIDQPRFDQNGRFAGYIGASMDVTPLREAEVRQTMLMNELNHRVKNTLSTVQSIAQQTIRPEQDPKISRDQFIDRLMALSAAHNVLNREHWTSVDLVEIAATAVGPYGEGGRIHLRGPKARVAPNVAVGISMALHELATNAAKYGALSQAGGAVWLAWKPSSDGARLCLRWRERGGPPAGPPARRGFGTRLLTQGLAGEFGAPAKLEYLDTGMLCTLSTPLLLD